VPGGTAATANTIGIVCVTRLRAATAGLAGATISSTSCFDQRGRQLGKLAPGLRPERRDHDRFAFHVPQLAQALTQRIELLPMSRARTCREESDVMNLPRLLRLSGARRREGTSQRGQQEAAAVHH
jgi:hypothetical protein